MKTTLGTLLHIGFDHLHTKAARLVYRFAFSKSDRRAIGMLSVLILLTLFLRAYGLVKPIRTWRMAPSPNIGLAMAQDSTRRKSNYVPPSHMVRKTFTVDLNLADTFDLQEIRGIGSVFSKRIVKHREALGGFLHIEQLREVWGIDSALLEKIRPHVYIKSPISHKLKVNEADIKTLKKHPYLDYYQAKEIYLHRMKYGAFKSVEAVREVNLMDSGTFSRIAPYLSVD